MDLTATGEISKADTQIDIHDLGNCVFNANSNEIKSKYCSEYIHLEKKVAAVLKCLIDANGKVVTREKIFETVWPNAIVSDDSLNRCISVLRKKLREFNHNVEIKTHPKVGFHLEHDQTGDIPPTTKKPVHGEIHTEVHTEPILSKTSLHDSNKLERRHAPPAVDRRKAYINLNRKGLFILIGLILIVGFSGHVYESHYINTQDKYDEASLAVLSPNRVVILPIKLSAPLSTKYLNIEKDFRLLVANNPLMTTIASTELSQSLPTSALDIARDFNARFIFRGVIEEQDDRDLFAWNLVDGKTGDILLTKKINLAINNNDSNLRQILTEMIVVIAGTLYPNDKALQIDYIVSSADYLYLSPNSKTLHRPVISMLASIIANIDQNSVAAMKKLSKLLIEEMWSGRNVPIPFLDLAQNNLENAIELAPLDLELRILLVRLQITKYQWQSAQKTLEDAARTFDRGQIENMFSSYEFKLNAGYISEEIIEHFQKELAEDPLSIDKRQKLISVLLRQGKPAEAIAHAKNLDSNQWAEGNILLGPASVRAGELEQGKIILIEGYKLLGIDQSYVDVLYQGLVYPDYASQASVFLTQAANNGEFERALLLDIYALLGDTTRYFDLAFELTNTRQFNLLTAMGEHSEDIRKSRRFAVLMNKIGIIRYWQEHGFPKYCSYTTEIAC